MHIYFSADGRLPRCTLAPNKLITHIVLHDERRCRDFRLDRRPIETLDMTVDLISG